MSMGRSEALFREYIKASRARDDAAHTHGSYSVEYSRASAELNVLLSKMPSPLIGRLS